MFCISGFSGVGKDEFVSRLVTNHGAVQTGLVDPAKRHMADIYGFSESQLFGPSKNRNSGDIRYPKTSQPLGFGLASELPPESNQWSDLPVPWWKYTEPEGTGIVYVRQHDPKYWLSPREALQRYCELMNLMYENTWIRKGIEIHKAIATGRYAYSRMVGLVSQDPVHRNTFLTAFADFRHHHEFRVATEAKTEFCHPVFIRIKSKRIPKPPFDHRSETEQLEIPDSKFDHIINNDGSIDDLHRMADDIFQKVLLQYGSE
jgi:hypothetical protein